MKNLTTQIKGFFSTLLGKNTQEAESSFQGSLIPERFKSLDSFIFLWKSCMKKMKIHTSEEISFSRYFTFGSDISYIKRFVGRPMYAMGNSDLNISILLYTVNIKGHNVKFELHFHDNKLFFINYTYNFLTREERDEIIHSLEEKYHVKSTDFNNNIIVDNSGNGILVEEKEKLTINYLAPNSNVRHLTEAYPHIERRAI